MQVELTEIVAKYREELSEATHRAVCFQIAVGKLESENKQLQTKLDLLQAAQSNSDPNVSYLPGEVVPEVDSQNPMEEYYDDYADYDEDPH